ncbi:DUF4249 domain-containing protein [Runella sp. MFBS21]|uniref:DUF4249 domain-containing protein n=1 Tax=Runella sp. MFBS21 TaxID=3034018 RepID=UPI0023F73882|nr:DUF4249 domain-containing protein [Runella sp. MFBS21]MDF7818498.1 DUF4249 domain-containing protein [Runella sp. MFBS21]
MKKKLFYYGLLLGSFLLSCQSPILVDTIDLPDASPQVMVYSMITPADSIEVHLKWANPIQAQIPLTQTGIANARVVMYHGQDSLVVPPLKQAGRYRVSQTTFKIRAGEEYRLVVKVQGQPTIRATCRVPSKAAVFSKISVKQITYEGEWQVTKEWQDVANSNEIIGYAVAETVVPIEVPIARSQLYDPRSIKHTNSLYFDDTIIFSHREYKYTSVTPWRFTLIILDKNAHEFLRMSWIMKDAQSYGEDDYLFAFRGLIPPFTNIENGLGVFGAYLTTKSSNVYLR